MSGHSWERRADERQGGWVDAWGALVGCEAYGAQRRVHEGGEDGADSAGARGDVRPRGKRGTLEPHAYGAEVAADGEQPGVEGEPV